METHPPHDSDAFGSDGLSRRAALRIGTGGFALALMTGAIETAQAQDATPPAAALPAGVSLASLSGFPVRDLPTKPFKIQASRFTLEPGAVVPNSASPYPSAAYVEDGNDLTCPPGGERWIYGPDGKAVASGAGTLTFPVGTWCYTPPNAMDGVRNDGTKRTSLLILELVPMT